LLKGVNILYQAKEEVFSKEIMRKVEREVYLQILDDLWMQHLENMDHLREGIHWMSVGQRDPLVEYRRQSQIIFDQMQNTLRTNVIKTLFHAEPVATQVAKEQFDTALTRAARGSVDNASKITQADEFTETDFLTKKSEQRTKKQVQSNLQKKRKAERQRRNKTKRRK